MTYRFLSLSPDDLLATTCPSEACGQTTLHGLVSRLTWVWAVPGESVRPAVVCSNCLTAAGDVFPVVMKHNEA